MFTPSPRARLLAAAMLSFGLGTAAAAPTVVDFEAAPPLTLVGPTQPDLFYQEGDVRFTPADGDALVDLSFCAIGAESCITNNNGVYLTALNGAQVTITGKQAFTLHALDAAFFPLPVPPTLFAGLPMGLSMVGSLWGGGAVSQVLALAEDPAAPGDFVFSSYTPVGLTALASVTLSACYFVSAASCVSSGADFDAAGLLHNDMQFAIDNLSISAVPEPTAPALLALGVAALSLRRRQAR